MDTLMASCLAILLGLNFMSSARWAAGNLTHLIGLNDYVVSCTPTGSSEDGSTQAPPSPSRNS